ncbi:hypothetical protein [Paraburkholderia rhizosphaerae]|uniref:hypothetical protein n=1 Tax=Paraburkholderia rhizosphaerae TaxID=480658 RepID=UPI001064BD0B|nr:hypothetical protein [Paraburkholderia rhizosphaerae]
MELDRSSEISFNQRFMTSALRDDSSCDGSTHTPTSEIITERNRFTQCEPVLNAANGFVKRPETVV